MHDLLSILRRFIPPYKMRVAKSILYNFLHAIFGSLSIAMLIPILGIIFSSQQDVTEKVPFALDTDTIKQLFNYYVTQIKYEYGASATLILIGGVAIVATALKTGFAYLGSYELIFIRNGVVRDIRRKIYLKILSLPLPFFSEERKGDIIAREFPRHVLPKPHPHPRLPHHDAPHELATHPFRLHPPPHHGMAHRPCRQKPQAPLL